MSDRFRQLCTGGRARVPQNEHTDLSGATIGGCWLIQKLGAGEVGAVYRAKQRKPNRTVTVKVLFDAYARQPEVIRGFEKRLEPVWKLKHPNVAQVCDYGFDGDTYYIISEFVPGRGLSYFLDGRRLRADKAARIAELACRGLDAAEQAGLCHQHLSADNIVITKDGAVKVTDLGLTPEFGSASSVRTSTEARRADIQALGRTFYHLLTDRMPLASESEKPVLPPLPREFNRRLSLELAVILQRMVATDAPSCYRSYDELISDLKRVGDNDEVAERLRFCPECGYGFCVAQKGEYACPNPECGFHWQTASPTEELVFVVDHRQPTHELVLLQAGQDARTFRLSEGVTKIGRTKFNDIILRSGAVSAFHARLTVNGSSCEIQDTESKTGVLVNKAPVHRRRLRPGDEIQIANARFRYAVRFEPMASPAQPVADDLEQAAMTFSQDGADTRRMKVLSSRVSIGRAHDRDVILKAPFVSRKHAVLAREQDGVFLLDTNSLNGTYVNGEPIVRRKLEPDDQVQIGPLPFRFESDMLVLAAPGAASSMDGDPEPNSPFPRFRRLYDACRAPFRGRRL